MLFFWLAVVLFDHSYLSLGNFDPIAPVDVIGAKSYMDSLFDPSCTSEGHDQ